MTAWRATRRGRGVRLDPLTRATELTAAQRVVLEAGLSDGGSGEQLVVPVADVDPLVAWATTERLAGLLWRAITDGRLDAGDAHDVLRAATAERQLERLRQSLGAEATAVSALDRLSEAGIGAVVFKGLAAAHLDHDDPAVRTFVDADLLVAREALPHAVHTLEAAGFIRQVPPIRPGWERRFARAVVLEHPAGVELDLHAAIAPGYVGERLDHAALLQHRESILLGGRTVWSLDLPGRIIVSSCALVLSRGPGLRQSVDLARQLDGSADAFAEALERSGETWPVLVMAAYRVHDELGAASSAVAERDPVDPATLDRRMVRALVLAGSGHRVGWSADARGTLLALGPGDRVRFLAPLVWPSREYRRATGGGPVLRTLRRVSGAVRGRLGGTAAGRGRSLTE